MRLKFALLPLIVTLLAPAALLAANQKDQGTSRAPVAIVELNNNGDVRLLLAVYNDGGAILSRKDATHPEGEICSSTIPPEYLANFQNLLFEAGALHLSDGPVIPGAARRTLSFFIGPDFPGRTRGNTFNWWRSEGDYLPIALAINALMLDNFGDCE